MATPSTRYWSRVARRAGRDTREWLTTNVVGATGISAVALVLVYVVQWRVMGLSTGEDNLMALGITLGVVTVCSLGIFLVRLARVPIAMEAEQRSEHGAQESQVRAQANADVARARDERDALERRLEELERGKPRLRMLRIHVDQRSLISATGEVMAWPFFAHMDVKNDPEGSAPTAIADVLAELTYFDMEGNTLFQVAGRWGDSDQPAGRDPLKSVIDLQRARIDIGAKRELNLAMKYADDEDCFAFSNEVYQVPGWKHPTHLLRGRQIAVRVRLRGVHVDAEWRLILRHRGRGSALTISEVP